jgi:hypothetical protein
MGLNEDRWSAYKRGNSARKAGETIATNDYNIDQAGTLTSGYRNLGNVGQGLAQSGNAQNAAGFGQSQAGNTQQGQLAGAVMDRAMGRGGPSVAELQMQRGLGQAQNAAASQAASMRGVNPALAARMGAQAQTQLANQNVENTGMLRANEQIAAQNTANTVLGTQRGQNLQQQQLGQGLAGMGTQTQFGALAGEGDIEKTNANQWQQQYLSGVQGEYGIKNTAEGKKDNRGFGDKVLDALSDEREKWGKSSLPGSGLDNIMDNIPSLGSQSNELGSSGSGEGFSTEPQKEEKGDWNNQDFLVSSLTSGKPLKGAVQFAKNYALAKGIGALASMSDKREKAPLDEFANALEQSYSYKYKDPKFGAGPRVGVMAQDLNKTQLGHDKVVHNVDVNGKPRMALDVNNALGIALATIGRLNERLDNLEGKGRK